jgi:hypothetical protein
MLWTQLGEEWVEAVTRTIDAVFPTQSESQFLPPDIGFSK